MRGVGDGAGCNIVAIGVTVAVPVAVGSGIVAVGCGVPVGGVVAVTDAVGTDVAVDESASGLSSSSPEIEQAATMNIPATASKSTRHVFLRMDEMALTDGPATTVPLPLP